MLAEAVREIPDGAGDGTLRDGPESLRQPCLLRLVLHPGIGGEQDLLGGRNIEQLRSFPAGDVVGLPGDEPEPLGDIVVCASVVQDESVEQSKAVRDHWAHMLVHGTLHLLGYDHLQEAEAVEMEALEKSVLARYGLDDPYGESG